VERRGTIFLEPSKSRQRLVPDMPVFGKISAFCARYMFKVHGKSNSQWSELVRISVSPKKLSLVICVHASSTPKSHFSFANLIAIVLQPQQSFSQAVKILGLGIVDILSESPRYCQVSRSICFGEALFSRAPIHTFRHILNNM